MSHLLHRQTANFFPEHVIAKIEASLLGMCLNYETSEINTGHIDRGSSSFYPFDIREWNLKKFPKHNKMAYNTRMDMKKKLNEAYMPDKEGQKRKLVIGLSGGINSFVTAYL